MILADHLHHATTVARCVVSEPFEFIRPHVIEIPLGLEAGSLWEFREALADVEVGAIFNHVCEARMRKKPLSMDFAYWLSSAEGLGLRELALKVERVGRLGLSLEGMRIKIILFQNP